MFFPLGVNVSTRMLPSGQTSTGRNFERPSKVVNFSERIYSSKN